MTPPALINTPRLRDWPERLDDVMRRSAGSPFAWGVQDCCTFASDCVRALTGVDVMDTLAKTYDSALQAAHVIEAHGGLRAAVTALLGPECDPATVTVGDVLLVQNEGRELVAVCNGTNAVAPGPAGLGMLADPVVLAAWRVG